MTDLMLTNYRVLIDPGASTPTGRRLRNEGFCEMAGANPAGRCLPNVRFCDMAGANPAGRCLPNARFCEMAGANPAGRCLPNVRFCDMAGAIYPTHFRPRISMVISTRSFSSPTKSNTAS